MTCRLQSDFVPSAAGIEHHPSTRSFCSIPLKGRKKFAQQVVYRCPLYLLSMISSYVHLPVSMQSFFTSAWASRWGVVFNNSLPISFYSPPGPPCIPLTGVHHEYTKFMPLTCTTIVSDQHPSLDRIVQPIPNVSAPRDDISFISQFLINSRKVELVISPSI